MRLSLVVTALSVISLAACSSAPKAPAAPVQANQAAAPSNATTADTTQARPRRKYCSTGSRVCSDQPDSDPNVNSGPAGGLSNSSTNAASGGPH